MREILFRGKRVDNGEWVEGYYLCQKNNYIGTRHYIYVFGDKEYNEYCDEDSRYEVDPTTVGQYTGLQDKNGKKIFEGDIVKIDDDSTYKFEVKFGKCSRTKFQDEGHIGIYFDCINVKYIRNDPLFWVTRKHGIKIIGNIHDNPELLEVK